MSAERLAVPNHLDEEKQEKLNRDLRIKINVLGILQNNNLEEIRKLLEAGADANGIPRGYSVPPLSDVVLLRSTNVVECAELLLEHGADPNGGSHRHSFPLLQLISESSLHGHLMRVVPLVKLLLRHGAKVGRDAPVPDWSSWSIVQKARNYMYLHEIRAHNPHFPHTELAVRTEVFKIVRHAQLMQRWRRAAHQVGRLSLFFMRTFEEVHYRPEHAGAKRAKREFEGLQASSVSGS